MNYIRKEKLRNGLVVTVTGRQGTGKTAVLRMLMEALRVRNIDNELFHQEDEEVLLVESLVGRGDAPPKPAGWFVERSNCVPYFTRLKEVADHAARDGWTATAVHSAL